MTWVRIDDGMPDHPKFAEPDDEDAALAMWVRGLLYASKFRTGALVPFTALAVVSRSSDPERLAAQLVKAGLWKESSCGYAILGGGKEWSRYSDGYWSRAAYATVYARDLWTCRYCGSCEKLTIDHVVPRCQGGSDLADNLVVACFKCNHKKRGRTPEQIGMILLPRPRRV